jgi:prepilin-type N-terminal cleavage/methylation domain-containing protein
VLQVAKVTTQTLWTAPIRARGYTLIEMMVVTMLLALFSAILVPNYISIRDGQQRRAFYTQVVDVAGTARELAITNNSTMYLQADTSGNRLVIKQENNDSVYQTADGGTGNAPATTSSTNTLDTNPQQNIGTAPKDRSSDPTITDLPLSAGMAYGNFQLNGQASDSSSWKVQFYADGSSDAGAVEFTNKGSVKSLVINSKGGSKLVDGNIPDTSQDTWAAGTYVQRQQ